MPDTCVHVTVVFKSFNDFRVQTNGSRSQKRPKMYFEWFYTLFGST